MSRTESKEKDTSNLIERLRNIDPYDFEEFVGELWEQQGWETSVSQSSNDMGVDVVAEKTDGMVEQKLAIQVKRYSKDNRIGRDVIQQYHAMKVQDASADAAVVVTTSSFTTPAEEWAAEHNVKLIDGDDLVAIIRDNNAFKLLDEYAPTLQTAAVDPASESGTTENPTSSTRGSLPEPLADDDTRQTIFLGGVIAGVVLIANPWGMQVPIEVLGTLITLAATAVWQYPAEVWSRITPNRTVHKEFNHGGVVVETGSTVQYEPTDDRDPIVFDKATDEQERRQRATVYGSLDGEVEEPLPETNPGVIPTAFASQGEKAVVAYRYAVHHETPTKIATDMNLTQQEVVDYLAETANSN